MKIINIYKSEDAHGNPSYMKCDHCNRNIVYVVEMSDGSVVGTDCAVTLELSNLELIEAKVKFLKKLVKLRKSIFNSYVQVFKKKIGRENAQIKAFSYVSSLSQEYLFENTERKIYLDIIRLNE